MFPLILYNDMARKTKRKAYKRKQVRFLGGQELELVEEEGGNRKTRKHRRKFKKVLCSPAKKNNIASSCYSPSELVTIKNAFNKHHSKSGSTSTSSSSLTSSWTTLAFRSVL